MFVYFRRTETNAPTNIMGFVACPGRSNNTKKGTKDEGIRAADRAKAVSPHSLSAQVCLLISVYK